MNQTGTLSNFEIGYSGRILRSSSDENLDHIEYRLIILPALNNAGNDYPSQMPIIVFLDILLFPEIVPPGDPEEISANKLIMVPISPTNVNIGDRIVLFINIQNFNPDPLAIESLTVQASVHFTPST